MLDSEEWTTGCLSIMLQRRLRTDCSGVGWLEMSPTHWV